MSGEMVPGFKVFIVESQREGEAQGSRSQPWPCGEREERIGRRRARDENKRFKSLRERGGAKQPLLQWAGLSCSCRVTVGRSIPGYCQVTVRVESSQNARSLGHCLCDLQSQNYGVGGSVVSGTCLWERGSLFHPLQSFLLSLRGKLGSTRTQAAFHVPTDCRLAFTGTLLVCVLLYSQQVNKM